MTDVRRGSIMMIATGCYNNYSNNNNNKRMNVILRKRCLLVCVFVRGLMCMRFEQCFFLVDELFSREDNHLNGDTSGHFQTISFSLKHHDLDLIVCVCVLPQFLFYSLIITKKRNKPNKKIHKLMPICCLRERTTVYKVVAAK